MDIGLSPRLDLRDSARTQYTQLYFLLLLSGGSTASLSTRKQIILEFLERIRQELERCIDRHSKKIISKYIELLLDYCTRFYERQFITRSEVNKKVFREFNHLLDNHFNVKVSLSTDVLSDEYCANLLHLSPAYFNDLLKYEIGKEFKEYIQFKRFEIAKDGW